jgi:hypothetical protein
MALRELRGSDEVTVELAIGPGRSDAASPGPGRLLLVPPLVDRAALGRVVPGKLGRTAVGHTGSSLAEGAHHRIGAGGAACASAQHSHAWMVPLCKQGKPFSASLCPAGRGHGCCESGRTRRSTAPGCVATRAETAAAGGPDRRTAKNADAPMDQSREAHRSARPLHSPRGHPAPDAPRPRAATRSHARVGMTLPPAASVGAGLISREARDVLSYRYASSPDRARPDIPPPKVLLSKAIGTLTTR